MLEYMKRMCQQAFTLVNMYNASKSPNIMHYGSTHISDQTNFVALRYLLSILNGRYSDILFNVFSAGQRLQVARILIRRFVASWIQKVIVSCIHKTITKLNRLRSVRERTLFLKVQTSYRNVESWLAGSKSIDLIIQT